MMWDEIPLAVPYRIGGGADPLGVLTADGSIFRADGQPWRLKGVTAFGQLHRFAAGLDIDGFLSDVAGANTLRVWPYVDWPGTGWGAPSADVIVRFIQYVGERGFIVYLTLLTSDENWRLLWAQVLVQELTQARLPNLILEIGNEPTTHKNINTAALRTTLMNSGYLFTSGNYEDSDLWFGSMYDCHTARDAEWPRRAHDLMEFYEGAGPDKPTVPHHVPCIAGEPAKREDVSGNHTLDFRAYFGVCALLGAGGIFHFENGKYSHAKLVGGELVPADGRPNAIEKALLAEALNAMTAFPADAPLGPYHRPIDTSLRTYIRGNYMVRVRPTTPVGVVPGTPLDADGVLWIL
jgi:hypothetical protein